MGLSLQNFGLVKEWLISGLHEIIRMWDVIAWIMVFILLFDRGRQGEELKLMKYDLSLVFLAYWDLLPKSLGR